MSHVLLGASASVAVYKACHLASALAQKGHAVRTALTPAAAKLVSPQLFEAVTGEPAGSTEFGPDRRGAMDHIDLALWAELVVVAPCTADLAARIACGMGDDLLTTALLAIPRGIPRLLFPAMNPNMLNQPAVARNLAQLREDGWQVAEPDEGHTACGIEGRGRLPEPDAIVAAVEAALASR